MSNNLDALADELERVFSRTRTTQHIAVDAGLVQDILTALRSIAAPKQAGYIHFHSEHAPSGEFGHSPLTEYARANGWTEIAYNPPAKPAPAEPTGDAGELVDRLTRVAGLRGEAG